MSAVRYDNEIVGAVPFFASVRKERLTAPSIVSSIDLGSAVDDDAGFLGGRNEDLKESRAMHSQAGHVFAQGRISKIEDRPTLDGMGIESADSSGVGCR